MNTRLLFLLTALALLPFAGRAQSEPTPQRSLSQRLSLTGTLSINRGTANGSVGGGLWARMPLGATERFSAGLLVEGTFSGLITEINGQSFRETYIPLLLTGSYALSRSRFRPFVGLGLGLSYSRRPSLNEQSSFTQRERIPFVLSLHIGADYRLSDRWGLHARIQSDYVFRQNDHRINVPLHLGVGYRFGR